MAAPIRAHRSEQRCAQVRIGLEENSERLRSDNAELRAELAQYEMKKKKKKGQLLAG